jgi:hypothetical protein
MLLLFPAWSHSLFDPASGRIHSQPLPIDYEQLGVLVDFLLFLLLAPTFGFQHTSILLLLKLIHVALLCSPIVFLSFPAFAFSSLDFSLRFLIPAASLFLTFRRFSFRSTGFTLFLCRSLFDLALSFLYFFAYFCSPTPFDFTFSSPGFLQSALIYLSLAFNLSFSIYAILAFESFGCSSPAQIFANWHEVIGRILSYFRRAKIRTFLFEKLPHPTEDEIVRDRNCSFCHYAVGVDNSRRLPCGHCLHSSCLEPWIRAGTKCLICRADINEYIDDAERRWANQKAKPA